MEVSQSLENNFKAFGVQCNQTIKKKKLQVMHGVITYTPQGPRTVLGIRFRGHAPGKIFKFRSLKWP